MKTKSILRITVILLIFCLSLSAFAQNGSAIEKAAAIIESLQAETQAAGIAVSIGIKGKIVWSQGFGYADVEQRVPVRPAKTRFRVGSVAKPMTAVAIAQLYEQGRLDLDAPVQRHVPSFPQKRAPISTRLIAGHLSGIRHYRGNEFLITQHYDTVLEGLSIFQEDTLLYAPGSKYAYSSHGWNLLSAVVEGASGQDFLTYMNENVFKPIGMANTIADHVDSLIANRGRYYGVHDGMLLNEPAVDNSYKWAGGGFLSTSEDLVRFGFAHLNDKLLKPETIKLLWQSQQTSSGKKTGYGIGWVVRTDKAGRSWIGHSGGSVGGSTQFRIYPEAQVVLVIIANMSGLRYGETAERLVDIFWDNNIQETPQNN